MEEELRRRLALVRRYLSESARPNLLADLLGGLHPADVAHILRFLEPQERLRAFRQLPAKLAPEVLAEADEATRADLLGTLPTRQISQLLSRLPADEVTDIVGELTDAKQAEVLEMLPREESADVKELLTFDPESAGGIMDTEVIKVDDTALAVEAIEALRAAGDKARGVANVAVVDKRGRLAGMVPVQELVLASPVMPVTSIMNTEVARIPVDMDQEEVARSFRRYNLVDAPVVDAEGVLVGRITVEDVLDVMVEEAEEDLSRLAGTHEEDVHAVSVLRISRLRLPWLLLGLFGEFIAARVLGHFSATIESMVALAFFVPLVTAMAGSAATQASYIVVRGLATGEMDLSQVGRRLARELTVGMLNGLVCGLLVAGIAAAWRGNPRLGLVVGAAMLSAMTLATLLGSAVPVLFRRLRLDPALATGPFVTTSNDVLSLLLYFSLATSLLRWIG